MFMGRGWVSFRSSANSRSRRIILHSTEGISRKQSKDYLPSGYARKVPSICSQGTAGIWELTCSRKRSSLHQFKNIHDCHNHCPGSDKIEGMKDCSNQAKEKADYEGKLQEAVPGKLLERFKIHWLPFWREDGCI